MLHIYLNTFIQNIYVYMYIYVYIHLQYKSKNNKMKQLSSIFKQDPLLKQLKLTNLTTSNLTASFLTQSLKFYQDMIRTHRQEQLIKVLLKILQEKGNIPKKIKVLALWIQMFKITKYDLSDIIMNKKLKIFTKTAPLKNPLKEPLDKDNLQDYLLLEVLVPLYNYFMKLSVNQDLYKHCVIGKVPDNQVFRRGTKIRYIWVFKIYNLIHLLISILKPCCKILIKFPKLISLFEVTKLFYNDILAMNNFVIQALEQGSQDNFLLMPYFDMLQFYQSLSQQTSVSKMLNDIYINLKEMTFMVTQQKMQQKPSSINVIKSLIPIPRKLKIQQDVFQEIQTQAYKVKLISFTLKNPKKDFKRLETDYNEKLTVQKNRTFQTEQDQQKLRTFDYGKTNQEDFMEKYRNLD